MRKILLFVKKKPATVKEVKPYEETILYVYPKAKIKRLPIQVSFVVLDDGHCGAILFAADRYVSRSEILSAYEKLIMNPKRK